MKRVELGVFLPDAKNGFIRSTNSPAYYPSYRDQLEITLLAEEIGLDYVFSMLKWRGFGGSTQFWDASFESFSLMAALAAATKRVNLIATVNPLLYHPTLMAKMAATVDEVSGGRLGLNIITGASLGEYSQMGILPEGYDEKRYAFATEWVQVLKRLWTEPSVTHDGEYFHLEECVSEPKPVQKPYPFLVCAGTSDEGLRFTAREADYAFVGRSEAGDRRHTSVRARAIAEEEQRIIKTASNALLIIRDTKAEAEDYWEHLLDGADVEANANNGKVSVASTRKRGQARGAEMIADTRRVSSHTPILGAPDNVAEQLLDLALGEGGLDSISLVFPDYVDGLRRFSSGVMPILREALDVGLQTT